MPKRIAKPRIAKPLEWRLASCEAHGQFLAEACALFPGDWVRYKQISAELRVLVVEEGQNSPLLLDLMDELGVEYNYEKPSDFPTPLWLASDGPNWRAANHRSVPLRQFVNDGVAMSLGDRQFVFKELILIVAQQDGSAHEDSTIDEVLATMGGMLRIGNAPAFTHRLWQLGKIVSHAGGALMRHAIKHQNHQPYYFHDEPAKPGDESKDDSIDQSGEHSGDQQV